MKSPIHISFFILALLLLSCASKNGEQVSSIDAGTKTFCYKDSCQHLIFSLSLELPAGDDSASIQIRDSLIADFIRNVQSPGFSEGDDRIKAFDGDMSDAQSIVDYYGKAAYQRLLDMAVSDYKDRIQYLDEDTTFTEEDRERIKNDIPQWAFDHSIRKTTVTPSYTTYYSQTYCYYGGAHGGVTGTGAITFANNTGNKIERFLNADATKALQPFIRKGLIRYYSEAGDTITDSQLSERLQIEGSLIPQPANTPYPNEAGDSLIFTYGQYEIACYADGMPSFRIAVKDLAPYLTEEARKILSVNN